MLTVLWVMTVASAVGIAAALSGRTSVSAARNRVESQRALWAAAGCARMTQSTIDDLLESAPSLDDAASVWRVLDQRVRTLSLPGMGQCELTLEAAGTRLDVNAASEEMLDSVLVAMGNESSDTQSMVAALADWRDTDDVARPNGAESAWYASQNRAHPRNGPLVDLRELALVRGFEDVARFQGVLTTDAGRVSLATAPITVLRAVPGFTLETATLIAALHDAGTPVRDPLEILGQLSPRSADALMSRYSDIARVTTPDPDAWILSVRSASGYPPTGVLLTWRLTRSGRHCVVAQTRTYL